MLQYATIRLNDSMGSCRSASMSPSRPHSSGLQNATNPEARVLVVGLGGIAINRMINAALMESPAPAPIPMCLRMDFIIPVTERRGSADGALRATYAAPAGWVVVNHHAKCHVHGCRNMGED